MAIIIKRLSVEDQGADRHEVIAEVKQIIMGGNLQLVNFYHTSMFIFCQCWMFMNVHKLLFPF